MKGCEVGSISRGWLAKHRHYIDPDRPNFSMSSIKRDVKKKSSASTGDEILFSTSSPLL